MGAVLSQGGIPLPRRHLPVQNPGIPKAPYLLATPPPGSGGAFHCPLLSFRRKLFCCLPNSFLLNDKCGWYDSNPRNPGNPRESAIQTNEKIYYSTHLTNPNSDYLPRDNF
jgi:hypothetical protein